MGISANYVKLFGEAPHFFSPLRNAWSKAFVELWELWEFKRFLKIFWVPFWNFGIIEVAVAEVLVPKIITLHIAHHLPTYKEL